MVVGALCALTACSNAETEIPHTSGGGNGGGGGGSDPACAAFTDVPATADVLIRYVNHRAESLFVESDCRPAFAFAEGASVHFGGIVTAQTCLELQTQVPDGSDYCPPGLEIAPGAAWEGHWTGLYYDLITMPLDCYPSWPTVQDAHDNPLLQSCIQPVPAKPGPLHLMPQVYTSPIPVSGPIQLAGKDFVFGTDTVVEIVIE